MKRILIVEDDPALVIGMSDFVRSLGYEVTVARDGEQGLRIYETIKPDLVLLDLMLPKRNGLEVCRAIRGKADATPIIMVTAKGQLPDRVAGLNVGADDYVTKPFDLQELAARIRAVLRRTEVSGFAKETVQTLGSVKIDLNGYRLERDGQSHELSARERDILAFLLARRNKVVTRNELLDEIWGRDAFPSTRTIDNYIVALRKKLEGDPAEPQILLSVRAAGYKLVDPGAGNG